MKYCEQYAALLDLYLDGELPPEELERVQSHLETCPGCQAYVDDGLAIRAGFPEVEDTEVPEGFAERVMERIREASGREKKVLELRRRSARRWVGSLAALAACCGLVLLTWGGPGDGASYQRAAPAGGGDAPVLYAIEGGAEDCAAADEGAESVPESGETAGSTEEGETVMTSMDALRNRAAEASLPAASPAAPTPSEAPAAPEAAKDNAQVYVNSSAMEKQEKQPALCLTEEEAGDLLDGFAVVWENGMEWRYELTAEEYRTLLEALSRPEELPEEAEGPFLVAVTGPIE